MDEINNPNNSMNSALRLKKVKRPINRMAPLAPMSPIVNETSRNDTFENINKTEEKPVQNPFIQERKPQAPSTTINVTEDDFNIDAYLDVEERLPSGRNVPSKFSALQTNFIEDDYNENEDGLENYQRNTDLPEFINKKVLILLAVVIFFVGFVMAKVMFSEEKVVRNGLQGIVTNAEVPRGRARCGVAEKTQGCVLYLMNPQRQDLSGRDFYDLASQLTGRQRFVIETGNMRYSNIKIRPGDIAQINIPPL